MIFDQAFLMFCNSFGNGSAACQSALNASSTKTEFSKNIDEGQKIAEKEFYKIIPKDDLVLASGPVYVYNVYKTKEIKFQTNLNPIFDEVAMDLTENQKTYRLLWKWKF